MAQRSVWESRVFAAAGAVLLWDGVSRTPATQGRGSCRSMGPMGHWDRPSYCGMPHSCCCYDPSRNIPESFYLSVWLSYRASLPVVLATVVVRVVLSRAERIRGGRPGS